MSKFLSLLFFLSVFLMPNLADLTYAAEGDEDEKHLNQILSSPPKGFSQEYWAKAVKSYLGSCSSGSCQCLFGVTEKQDTVTGLTWFGTLASGEAKSVFHSTGRIQYAKWKGPYNKKLPKCIAGSSWAVPNPSNPGQCCRTGGHKAGLCRSCKAYQDYASYVGLAPSSRMKIIYFASQLDGQILLHDSYGCGGKSCTAGTWGCSTIAAAAMKDLCFNYLGQSTGVNDPLVGTAKIDTKGVWYFFHGNGNSNEASAKKGLKKVKEQCNSITYAELGTGGSFSGSLQSSSQSSTTMGTGPSNIHGPTSSLGSFSNMSMFQALFASIEGIGHAVANESKDDKNEEEDDDEDTDEKKESTPSSETLIVNNNGAYSKAGGNAADCFIINGERICE